MIIFKWFVGLLVNKMFVFCLRVCVIFSCICLLLFIVSVMFEIFYFFFVREEVVFGSFLLSWRMMVIELWWVIMFLLVFIFLFNICNNVDLLVLLILIIFMWFCVWIFSDGNVNSVWLLKFFLILCVNKIVIKKFF